MVVGQAGLRARDGGRIPRRFRVRGPAVSRPDRYARDAAGAEIPCAPVILVLAKSLPPALLRSLLRRSLLGRRGGLRCDGGGTRRRRTAVAGHARMACAVGAVPVDRERRADLVLVRLGVAAARGGTAGGLRRQRRRRPSRGRDVADTLAAVPRRVRRRSDQAARRSVLARPLVSGLPPRDAADAGPAQLVLPPPATSAAPGRGGGQPRRAVDRAVRIVRPAAGREHRGGDHRRDPVLAGAVGELLVAEPADDRVGAQRDRL